MGQPLGGLGNNERCSLDYKDLPKDVKAGDTLLLNDGLIVLDVDRVSGGEIHTTVRIGGELSNNKGINKQGGGLSAPALTGKDVRDIDADAGRGLAHQLCPLQVVLRGSVREVETDHVDAGGEHALEDQRIAGSGSERGNDLGAAWHGGVTSLARARDRPRTSSIRSGCRRGR